MNTNKIILSHQYFICLFIFTEHSNIDPHLRLSSVQCLEFRFSFH